jgi:hypothetical protein
MNFWKKAITMLVIMLLGTAAPAFAATETKVSIVNKTGEDVTLTIRGPEKLTVEVNKNTTAREELKPGTYTYRYKACGRTINGTAHVAGPSFTIRLPKCGNPLEVKVTVVNLTNGPFRLVLTGAKASYSFYIPSGTSNVTVANGGYSFSAFICGDTETGRLKAKPNQNNEWRFAKCN